MKEINRRKFVKTTVAGAAAVYKMNEEFSENRIGKLLPKRRKEVFLVTKVMERDEDAARASIERNFSISTSKIRIPTPTNTRGMSEFFWLRPKVICTGIWCKQDLC